MTQSEKFETTDLNQMVAGVISDLEVSIEEKKARIGVGPLSSINAVPVQMKQLFQNLIANALKFSKDGEPPVIKISEKAADKKSIEIHVADNGIGFDENFLDRIFKPFERLHGHGEYEGSGMGLAICRKIVSRHGGTLSAESEKGKGATFIINLPKKSTEMF